MQQQREKSSKLGVPSKRRMKDNNNNNNNTGSNNSNKCLSVKAQKSAHGGWTRRQGIGISIGIGIETKS